MRKFLTQLRSQFYCNICDFDNQFYFKYDKKKIEINLDSCNEISKKTAPFAYLMYVKVFRYLNQLSKVVNYFQNDS